MVNPIAEQSVSGELGVLFDDQDWAHEAYRSVLAISYPERLDYAMFGVLPRIACATRARD